MTEQTVKIGQVWRRKRDGMVVRITSYESNYADCGWREVDGKRRGQIFAYNLFDRYELMGEAGA